MRCAWKELMSILPPGLRTGVDELGRDTMQELRLRLGGPPELVLAGESRWLSGCVTQPDLDYVVNAASRYSPWAAATGAQGYLTAPGGHRIGLCGETVCRGETVEGIRHVRSLCIRVARDLPGIGNRAACVEGSILVLGAPGWGKTTLLRDLIRRRSEECIVGVVDERRELFPESFPRGKRMDVLWGCPKARGMEMLLRTMTPEYIAMDEITAEKDCEALIQGANCGVKLLATAHASSVREFTSRRVYRSLVENRIFGTVLQLRRDKTYTLERMEL